MKVPEDDQNKIGPCVGVATHLKRQQYVYRSDTFRLESVWQTLVFRYALLMRN
jgi:hypothetical protein